MWRGLLLLICLPAVLFLASCGGGSSDPPSTETSAGGQGDPPSKTQFIAQADDACRKLKKEDAPLESRYGKLASSASNAKEFNEAADLVRQLTGYAAREVTQLKALEPPAADEEVLEELFEAIGDRATAGKEFAQAIEDKDQAGVNSLTKQAATIGKEEEALAKSYGFKVCGGVGK